MEFIIDKSKWRAGQNSDHQVGEGNTELLNKEGYMCCLGQCEFTIRFERRPDYWMW